MKDSQILQAIGLSEADATDLASKHQAYLRSLNPAQLAVVNSSLPSPEEAAAAISSDCTADDINNFVKARCNAAPVAGALALPGPVADTEFD